MMTRKKREKKKKKTSGGKKILAYIRSKTELTKCPVAHNYSVLACHFLFGEARDKKKKMNRYFFLWMKFEERGGVGGGIL